MSLLPDDDEFVSLLPPEEQNAPDPDLYVDGGGNINWEERKKVTIPKYANLMPKRVIAKQMGGAAFVIDVLLGLFLFTKLLPYIQTEIMVTWEWNPLTWDILGLLQYLLAQLTSSRNNMMLSVLLIGFAILLTSIWSFSERKVSKCPVCKKKNYKNYHVCSKCDYIFYSRDIINREILSVKLNNLEFSPAEVRQEFIERRLADLDPKYIRSILAKNHFL